MRHGLIDRLVVVLSVVLVAAGGLFALGANVSGEGRVDAILTLEPDIDRGRDIYNEIAQPACAACHSFRDAGAFSVIASDLDELRPSARVSAQSLIGGGIPGHDRENYEHELSNQDIADVIRYIEQFAGAGP